MVEARRVVKTRAGKARSGNAKTPRRRSRKRTGRANGAATRARSVAPAGATTAATQAMVEALRRSEERLRRVISDAPIVLWAVDADGVFTFSEGRGLVPLGLAPGEVVGRSLFDLYAPYPVIVESVKRCLARGEETHFLAEVGKGTFDTRVTPTPERDGAIGVSVDVSERLQMEQRLRVLSRRLWSIHEEERRRIARDLHDEAGQAMTALKLQLDLARREPDPERVRAQLEAAALLAGDVLDELRRISSDLRPGALEELGLVPSLRALVERSRQRAGIRICFFEPSTDGGRGETEVELALFRFVQEALDNVARHARASRAVVSIQVAGDVVRAMVEDDGAGFDPAVIEREAAGSGVGLAGIRERVRLLGGSLKIDSTPAGGGARLLVELPFRTPSIGRV